MQRSILAALVALSLGACSSDNDSTIDSDGSVIDTPNIVDAPVVTNDPPATADVAEVDEVIESSDDQVTEPESADDASGNVSTFNDDVVVVNNPNPTDSSSGGSDNGAGSGAGSDSTNDNAAGPADAEDNQADTFEQDSDAAGSDVAGNAIPGNSENAAQTPEADDTQTAEQNSDAVTSNDAGSATADNTETASQTPDAGDNQAGAAEQNSDAATSDDAGGATAEPTETASQTPEVEDNQADTAEQNADAVISDDAGSATSDGGETAAQNAEDSQDGPAEQSANGAISDDAGSATSDGGETAAQNTEDSQDGTAEQSANGGISDDAGSASSDGGETAAQNAEDSQGADGAISDDAGSASSDGGLILADDAGSNDTTGSESGDSDSSNSGSAGGDSAVQAAAADFESDSIGGSVIRRSVLSAASSQVNICTTASDQQNFSDTRIGDFILHNNAWRPGRAAPGFEWTQCIYTNTNGALAGWNYNWGPGIAGLNGNPNPSGDFYVRSYPELIFGVKDEFRTSAPKAVTGLPVRLSELPNITIDYSYDAPQFGDPRIVNASSNPRFPNGTTISGERNIAIESFLYNPDANGECSENIVTRNGGSNHQYEVMVWLDAGAERLPAGPSDFVTDVNIRGEAFKVYTKESDERYIAFVAQNPQNSGTLVWNDFTDWARTYAHRVGDVFGARSNSVPIQDLSLIHI